MLNGILSDLSLETLVHALLKAEIPHFTTLILSYNNLTDDAIEPLVALMPHLEILCLSNNEFSLAGERLLTEAGKAHKVRVTFVWCGIEEDASQ